MFNQKEAARGCLSEAAAAKNRSPGKEEEKETQTDHTWEDKKELQLKEMIRNVEERTYFSKKWLDNIEQHRKLSV